MQTAVVFDLDGTLCNSETFWQIAEQTTFKKISGQILSHEDCLQTTGFGVYDVIEHRFQQLPWDDKAVTRQDVLGLLTLSVVSQVQASTAEAIAMPGAIGLLKLLKSKNIKIGLATNSPLVVALACLETLGVRDYFDAVCSSEADAYPKPHPAVYLRCCERLGMNPTKCLAFEDSLTGLIAAKAARMKCISIPSNPSEKFVVGDLVLQSLEQVTDALLSTFLV